MNSPSYSLLPSLRPFRAPRARAVAPAHRLQQLWSYFNGESNTSDADLKSKLLAYKSDLKELEAENRRLKATNQALKGGRGLSQWCSASIGFEPTECNTLPDEELFVFLLECIQALRAENAELEHDNAAIKETALHELNATPTAGAELKTMLDQVNEKIVMLQTDNLALKTETQALKTETQALKTGQTELEMENLALKTETQALKTALKTETQALKTGQTELEMENLALKTETQALKTETQALKTGQTELETETRALKTETQALKTETQALKTGQTKLEDSHGQLETVVAGMQSAITSRNYPPRGVLLMVANAPSHKSFFYLL